LSKVAVFYLLIVVIIYLEMARTYKRKSKRGSLKMDYVMAAVRRVNDGDAIRRVAKEMNIDKSTPTTADSASVEPFASPSDSSDADKQSGPWTTSSLDCEQPQQQLVTSPEVHMSVTPPCESGLFSPKEIRPFPSAPPRKASGRRTGKSRILTDTPVKNELAQRQRQKALKSRKGSSEKESAKRVPSCSTNLFGSSQKRSVARGKKKAAKKPNVADAEKDNPPCLYCGELYSESRKELRHWIRCEGPCEK
jgi:hypothetical protein